MDYRKVIGLSLLAAYGFSHAGYAQLIPPVGATLSGSTVMYRAAANDVIMGGVARTAAGAVINVGGRAIVMPVAMRYASNAAQFAARGTWPLLALGLLAPIALDWVNEQGFFVQGGEVVKSDPTICTVGPCFEYAISSLPSVSFSSAKGACDNWAPGAVPGGNGYGVVVVMSGTTTMCQAYKADGSFWLQQSINKNGVAPKPAQYSPATQSEFESKMSAVPLPDSLPKVLPFPLPVEQPVINPDASPSPASQPLWIPLSNPQPVPLTDPQQYKQPGIRITPQPSPFWPWQVDVVPDDKISTNPSPVVVPEVVPSPEAGSEPKSDEPPDLCAQNPDILACQKLGSLSPEVLQKKTVPLTITKEDGFGPATGACPAPKTFVIMGKPMAFRWDLLCDFASQIRPLLVGFAYLSAALAFMGLSRKD